MKKLKPVFRILYWILMIFLLTVEPYQYRREPLTKDQVDNALPKGYLPAFYEHASELDYYYLDRETPFFGKVDETTVCFLQYNIFAFWQSSDVYVIKEVCVCEQESLSNLPCLAHEIGHAIDYSNGNVSETKEFREAVDLSIEMLKDDRSEYCSWCFVAEQITAEFPGINGNPLRRSSKGEWGGYKELYADLFAYGFSLDMIPPPLRIYYQDYLP